MYISSRERGQGATEYILIVALAIIFILGMMYIFRSSIGGTTEKLTSVVSGKTSQKGSSPEGSSKGKASSGAGEEKGAPGSSEAAKGESSNGGSSGDDSSGDGQEKGPEDSSGGRSIKNEGGDSGGKSANLKVAGGSARGLTMWVLIGVALVLVVLVGYFLSAASR